MNGKAILNRATNHGRGRRNEIRVSRRKYRTAKPQTCSKWVGGKSSVPGGGSKGNGTRSNRKCNIAASSAGKLRDARPCSEWCVTAQCVLSTGPPLQGPCGRDALVLQAPARPAAMKLRHHISRVNN